jgi:hypothetical protein
MKGELQDPPAAQEDPRLTMRQGIRHQIHEPTIVPRDGPLAHGTMRGIPWSNDEGRGRIISSPPGPSPHMPRCHQARGRRPAHASLNDPSLHGQCLPPHRPTTCLLTPGDLRLQKAWSAYATSLRWLGSRRWPRSYQRPCQRWTAAWHWPLRPPWPSRSQEQMVYGQEESPRAPSSPRSRPAAGVPQMVAATPPGELPSRRRTRRAPRPSHPRLCSQGVRACVGRVCRPGGSRAAALHRAPPPSRRRPQRSKPPGFPQKKAPADRLRATKRVQGRRAARQKGLTQPVIPLMLRETMRTPPRGRVGWRG